MFVFVNKLPFLGTPCFIDTGSHFIIYLDKLSFLCELKPEYLNIVPLSSTLKEA